MDDIGYLSSETLVTTLTDEELLEMIQAMQRNRYSGWRNFEGRWRSLFRLDSTSDSLVLDYGCGVGLEALQYAQRGNTVVLADIAESNIALAERVLRLFLCPANAGIRLTEHPPENLYSLPFDVIHCVGVLHHIPNWQEVIEAFHRWLANDGEVRLMLYSDIAYRESQGDFAAAMDGVGSYADWYDLERVKERFGEWFRIDRSAYLTENRHYLGVVLHKR